MKAFDFKSRFEEALRESLNFKTATLKNDAKKLKEALRYAMLGQAKRLRPLLVFYSAKAFIKDDNKAFKYALPASLAVEYIHGYSLVHDDLPSMDNDLFRRGRLSLHAKFDEALAILAGDCLLSDAFLILSKAKINPLTQVMELSKAIGRSGLVLGQIGDLSKSSFAEVNRLKTGKLFLASLALGALSVGANKDEVLKMKKIGLLWGEAFQLKDDLDDKDNYQKLSPDRAIKTIEEIKQKIYRELYFIDNKDILELFVNIIER